MLSSHEGGGGNYRTCTFYRGCISSEEPQNYVELIIVLQIDTEHQHMKLPYAESDHWPISLGIVYSEGQWLLGLSVELPLQLPCPQTRGFPQDFLIALAF